MELLPGSPLWREFPAPTKKRENEKVGEDERIGELERKVKAQQERIEELEARLTRLEKLLL